MANSPVYIKGDWKAICDVCGREYKASYLRKRWDGLMCCNDDWEPRHPQDFVRGVTDIQVPPWTRPEPSDNFIALPKAIASGYYSGGESTIVLTGSLSKDYLGGDLTYFWSFYTTGSNPPNTPPPINNSFIADTYMNDFNHHYVPGDYYFTLTVTSVTNPNLSDTAPTFMVNFPGF